MGRVLIKAPMGREPGTGDEVQEQLSTRAKEVRDMCSTLDVLSQCADSEPSSISETAQRISKSGAPYDAIQAAEIYLQQLSGLSASKTAEVGHIRAGSLLETLVDESRQESLERPAWLGDQAASSIGRGRAGLKSKKGLADVSRAISSACEIDLDCGGPFSLDGICEAASPQEVSRSPEAEAVPAPKAHLESCEPAIEQNSPSPSKEFSGGDFNHISDEQSLKSMQWDEIFRGLPKACTWSSSGRPSAAESTDRCRVSGASSVDSMSDDAISERAAAWGNGVAQMVLQNSSQESSPRSSKQSLALDFWNPRKPPRLSQRVDDVLSAFKIAFMVCDATDPRGPILYASAGFFRMTGYSAEEIFGKSCWFLEGANTDPTEAARIRDAVKKGQAYTGIILNYKKSGASFWNLFTLSPIIDDTGKVIKYIGMQAEVISPRVPSGRRELAVVPHWPSPTQSDSFLLAREPDDSGRALVASRSITTDAVSRSKRSDPAESLPVFALSGRRDFAGKPLASSSSRYPLTRGRCDSFEFRSQDISRSKNRYSLTIGPTRPSVDCSLLASADAPSRQIERCSSAMAGPWSESGRRSPRIGSSGSQPLVWHLAVDRNGDINQHQSTLTSVEEEFERQEDMECGNRPGGGSKTKLGRGALRILRLLGYLDRKLATASRQWRDGAATSRRYDMESSDSAASRRWRGTFAADTLRMPYNDLGSSDSEAVRRDIGTPTDLSEYGSSRRYGFAEGRSSDWQYSESALGTLSGLQCCASSRHAPTSIPKIDELVLSRKQFCVVHG